MKTVSGRKIIACICLLAPALSWAQEKITLHYNDRPPYLAPMTDGAATGLTASLAADVFKAAGIPFVWAKMPTNRQLALIKNNVGMDCGVGWFKNAERMQFAKFTKAIYRDKPTVLLAHDAFIVNEGTRLENIVAAKGVRILVKEGYSYGQFIDGLLDKFKPTLISTAIENVPMTRLISARSADFMFVSEEEANYLVEQAGPDVKNLHLVKFSDKPNGEKRHIMCSKQVPDEVIAKLNKAITFE